MSEEWRRTKERQELEIKCVKRIKKKLITNKCNRNEVYKENVMKTMYDRVKNFQ